MGLIVTNGDIRFHTSVIKCEATLGDLKETFKARLIFQPLPRFIRTPKMKFPKRKELKLGSNIEIECDISWESGSRHIDLKWDFPHASNAQLGNVTQVIKKMVGKKGSGVAPETVRMESTYFS